VKREKEKVKRKKEEPIIKATRNPFQSRCLRFSLQRSEMFIASGSHLVRALEERNVRLPGAMIPFKHFAPKGAKDILVVVSL
jgi:hypothetical protein